MTSSLISRFPPTRWTGILAGLAVVSATTVLAHVAAAADAEIARIADRVVNSGTVPGVIIGIYRPGRGLEVITRGVADVATRAPMNAANSQRIGSITKSFTVTRLLQLAEEGRLSLNDPIDNYVPGLRNGSATLSELADMTSGIFNYTEDLPFILEFAFNRTKVWTDRQIVAIANAQKPYFQPGEAWHYSNTNTILLGMVVERVTGNSLRAEITRNLIRPLGLDRTSYPTGIFLPPPFGHGYAILDDEVGRLDVTEISPSALSGAGAMISTVDDLRVWGRALARGTLVSRRSQLARLRMIDSSRGVGPFYDRYGLALGKIRGWLGHTAEVLGYQSLVMHNLVTNESVVIFVNSSNPTHVPTDMFLEMTPRLSRAIPNRPTQLRVTGKKFRSISGTTVTLRGRASSEAGILLVDSSTSGSPRRIARGSGRWQFEVPLQPGRNVIRIRAVDGLNRKSRVERLVINRS